MMRTIEIVVNTDCMKISSGINGGYTRCIPDSKTILIQFGRTNIFNSKVHAILSNRITYEQIQSKLEFNEDAYEEMFKCHEELRTSLNDIDVCKYTYESVKYLGSKYNDEMILSGTISNADAKIIIDAAVADVAAEIEADEAAIRAEAAETELTEIKLTEAEPTKAKPTKAKLAKDKPVEDKPAGGKPAGGKPAEDKPAEDKPAEDKPAEDKPTKAKPTKAKSTKNKPTKAKPTKAKPAEADKTLKQKTKIRTKKIINDETINVPSTNDDICIDIEID